MFDQNTMDSLRGCMGEAWDDSGADIGGAEMGDEGELVTMDTGVIKVEGLVKVAAGVTGLGGADLGMGSTRVC